jgi:glycosyltransferase involved in cell wall biosynthesis
MLTPYLPYPLLSGGQIRTYNLLKNLKDKHEIHLFSIIKDFSEKQHIPELEKFCESVNVFKRSKHPFTVRNVALALLTPYPFLVTRNLPIRAKNVLTKVIEKGQFDLIHVETFYVMPNIPKSKVPILLVEQTIEYLVYQDFVKQTKLPLIRPFLSIDVYKIKWWEQFYWRKAERLAAMSKEDKQFILNFIPKAQIDVVANGVDALYFNSVKRSKQKYPTILFVGQFKWLPNRDAVDFLYHEIWPQIKEKIPNCKLRIVGKHPTPEIKKLSQEKDVDVDDKVDDIREAYASADVLLAPIRSGRGTKYKILEAMASGTPVVATTLGIEGIAARHMKEALIEDSSSGLASRTVEILSDEKKAKQLAQAAKKLILSKYNWENISSHLDEIYKQLGKT